MIPEKYCHNKHLPPYELWGDNVIITCDNCKNAYIFCRHVHLQINMLPLIRIKPIFLRMTITFNRSDILSAISDFKTETDIHIGSSLCVIEIPIDAIKSVKPYTHWETIRRVVNTFQWGGTLYQSVQLRLKVSWEAAAPYCQESGANLLTIHSQAEYRFLQETFLNTYDLLVLYVGVKRKVIILHTHPFYGIVLLAST